MNKESNHRNSKLAMAVLFAGTVLAIAGAAASPALAASDAGMERGTSVLPVAAECDTFLAADLDQDCYVSGLDFFILVQSMGASATSVSGDTPGAPVLGDITGDGYVSGLDYFALIKDFGRTTSA
jgi:hypothetical protein